MTDIRVLTAPGALLGEGPLWSKRDQAIYWVDIFGCTLHSYALSGETRSWVLDAPIAWVVEREGRQGFIAGVGGGFVDLSLNPLTIAPIGRPVTHQSAYRMNDAKADKFGRIFAGTMENTGAEVGGRPPALHAGTINKCDVDRGVRNVLWYLHPAPRRCGQG